jgi:hypothetical protein
MCWWNVCILCWTAIMVFAGLAAAEECPTICPLIYDPVCASDGVTTRTFSNACSLNVYNCQNPQNRKLLQLKFYSNTTITIWCNFCHRQYFPRRISLDSLLAQYMRVCAYLHIITDTICCIQYSEKRWSIYLSTAGEYFETLTSRYYTTRLQMDTLHVQNTLQS